MPASGNSLRFNITIPSGRKGSTPVNNPEPVSDRAVSDTTVKEKTLNRRRSPPKTISPSKVISPPLTPDEQARAELLAILGKPYESNCAECNGKGVIGVQQCQVCFGLGLVKTRLI